jgi:hypothetical protein
VYYYLAQAYISSGDTEKGCEAWAESVKRKERIDASFPVCK